MEQYQLDRETIHDFLNKNINEFMGGKLKAYKFTDHTDDQEFLDSRQFCMELAKLIYGDKEQHRYTKTYPYMCKNCLAVVSYPSDINVSFKCWEYKTEEWSTLTNESLAHEAAEAIRQIKNNTLDK